MPTDKFERRIECNETRDRCLFCELMMYSKHVRLDKGLKCAHQNIVLCIDVIPIALILIYFEFLRIE